MNLLRLPTRCPSCGAPPAVRVPAATAERLLELGDLDAVFLTVQCGRRLKLPGQKPRACGMIHEVRMRDVAEAWVMAGGGKWNAATTSGQVVGQSTSNS